MAWAIQRVTAVYLAVLMIYLALHFIFNPPADYLALRSWVAEPLVSISLVIFVPLLLAHAWVGFRDVLLDYVKIVGLRVVLLALVAFMFLGSGLWAFKAIVIADVTAGIAG